MSLVVDTFITTTFDKSISIVTSIMQFSCSLNVALITSSFALSVVHSLHIQYKWTTHLVCLAAQCKTQFEAESQKRRSFISLVFVVILLPRFSNSLLCLICFVPRESFDRGEATQVTIQAVPDVIFNMCDFLDFKCPVLYSFNLHTMANVWRV